MDGVVGRPDGLDGLEAVEELDGEGGEVARAGGALALVKRVHHRRHLAGERAVVCARPHLGRRAQVVPCVHEVRGRPGITASRSCSESSNLQ